MSMAHRFHREGARLTESSVWTNNWWLVLKDMWNKVKSNGNWQATKHTVLCGERLRVLLCHNSRIWEMMGAWLKLDALAGLSDRIQEDNIRHSFSYEEMKAWRTAEYLVSCLPLQIASLCFSSSQSFCVSQ